MPAQPPDGNELALGSGPRYWRAGTSRILARIFTMFDTTKTTKPTAITIADATSGPPRLRRTRARHRFPRKRD